MTAPVQDLATMSADDQRRLLVGYSRSVSIKVECLGPDLVMRRDLTDRVQQSGSVRWDGDAAVHRGTQLTVALADDELIDWPTELLRLTMIIRDSQTGLAGAAPIGTFTFARPERSLVSLIKDPSGKNLRAYQVTGQDVTALLDRMVGYSYISPAVDSSGASIGRLTAAATALSDAGFPAQVVRIDGSAQAAAMRDPGTWPWFSSSSTSDADANVGVVQPKDATTDSSSGGPATWRSIVNDIVGQLVYRAVFADAAGYLRLVPYLDATAIAPAFVFDSVDPLYSSIAPERTRSINVAQYNTFSYVWTNMPNPDGGVPSYANGGVIDRQNMSDGPSSVQARGGVPRGVDPTLIEITAVTNSDFVAQAETDFAQSKRAVTTVKTQTVPYPLAGHFDVFLVRDPDLLGADQVRVQATSWELPLDGSPMSWEWTVINA